MTHQTSHQEVAQLERTGWDALTEGTGASFYGELMLTEGLMVLAHGMVLDRPAVVESLTDAPPWSSYVLSQLRYVDLGTDEVVVAYRADATRDDTTFSALMSSTYVRRDGRWRLAVHQQTVLPRS